ncbi:MAG TPA: TetR/AcrR family transcriptional regulator [Steroidobacteraceae bacterium]|nr:TetR/AcrR family transcriptional regulator [Steroidobacteraceae bacterium]
MVRTAAAALCNRDQRREHILSVARDVFFEHGYSATSMSAIAVRLGGSKGTLYNYFKSKEELFESLVRDMCGPAAEHILEPTSEGDPAGTLTALGERYLDHLYAQRTVKLFRILAAEAHRTPELARIFYEVGPARGRRGLEAYLSAANARGQLQVPDCALAAEQFLSLCKGAQHLKFILNLIPGLSAEEIRSQIARAVEAFMRLYGCKGAMPELGR